MGGVVRAETINQWFSYTGSERLLPWDCLFIYLFIFSLLFAYFAPTLSQISSEGTTHLKKAKATNKNNARMDDWRALSED